MPEGQKKEGGISALFFVVVGKGLFGTGLTFDDFGIENCPQGDVAFRLCWVVADNPNAVIGIAFFQYGFEKDLHGCRFSGWNGEFGPRILVRFVVGEFE